MNLTPLVIAMVLGSGVIIGMWNFYNDINTVYQPGNTISAQAEGNFTMLSQTFDKVNVLMGNIQNQTSSMVSAGFSPAGILDSVLVFFSVTKFILQAPGIMIGFLTAGLSQIMGVGGGNTWFIPMITTIVTVVFVSLVAAIVLKRLQSEI